MANPTIMALYWSLWIQRFGVGLALGTVAGILLAKILTDGLTAWALRRRLPPWRFWILIPVKDVIQYALWLAGFCVRQVRWRDHVLYVGPRSRLIEPRVFARWKRRRARRLGLRL